jgi:hypothetical protein
MRQIIPAFLLLWLGNNIVLCQDSTLNFAGTGNNNRNNLNYFIRGGFYGWYDKNDEKPYVSSAYSDIGIRLEKDNGTYFRAFGDLRYRYGAEFQKPVSRFDIREGYVTVYRRKWDLSAGLEILKWGRADFTNPTNKFSPRNMLSRSPDREDMDLGNILSVFNLFLTGNIRLQAVAMPFYRPSLLIIDPVPLPSYVTINTLDQLVTGKNLMTYGLKVDFYMNRIDWSLSWFDGYDPMPGISLSSFTLDTGSGIPVFNMILAETPYKIRQAGLDFETSAGLFGLRGEAAFSVPELSAEIHEFVPFPELKWVAGIDWSSGIWRLTGEYSGKLVTHFTPSLTASPVGTEPDYLELAGLLTDPTFDAGTYIKDQVGAFNRLYNYQVDRVYHSAGLKAEAELAYGRILPSVLTMYNFISGDLLVIPEVRLKPADGFTITGGAEIYSGRKNSLFDLVKDFMNNVYVSLRVDF